MTNQSVPSMSHAKFYATLCPLSLRWGVSASCMNGKEVFPVKISLKDMGHPESASLVVTKNNTASGVMNGTLKQKFSKAMDMHFYWLKGRV